jgi:hypothetical protein
MIVTSQTHFSHKKQTQPVIENIVIYLQSVDQGVWGRLKFLGRKHFAGSNRAARSKYVMENIE